MAVDGTIPAYEAEIRRLTDERAEALEVVDALSWFMSPDDIERVWAEVRAERYGRMR